jgi:hypothetical protein
MIAGKRAERRRVDSESEAVHKAHPCYHPVNPISPPVRRQKPPVGLQARICKFLVKKENRRSHRRFSALDSIFSPVFLVETGGAKARLREK